MSEPRLAKQFAIGLGAAEFLFGLAFSAILVIQGIWLAADPEHSDPWLWPVIATTAIMAVIGPAVLAYVAERASNPRVTYVCLAMLVAYPILTLAWANFRAA